MVGGAKKGGHTARLVIQATLLELVFDGRSVAGFVADESDTENLPEESATSLGASEVRDSSGRFSSFAGSG